MLDSRETNLVNQVFNKVEKHILREEIPQGTILDLAKLAKEMSVGIHTIREIMPLLKVEMLIEEEGDTYRVVGISSKDIEEMYQIKKTIEVKAFGLAAKNITDEDLEKLENILEKQIALREFNTVEEEVNLDTEFHDIVLKACGSIVYKSVLSPIHHRLAKYRKASLSEPERMFKSTCEHGEIFKALKAHNQVEAEDIAREHIDNAYLSILKHYENKGKE